MSHPMSEPAQIPGQKPLMSGKRKGCLGCLGCGGIALVVLIVLAVIGSIMGPQASSSTASASPSASPATSSQTPTQAPPATTQAPDHTTSSPGPSPTSTPPATEQPADGDAMEALNVLEVKGRAPKTGYDRDEFGQRWADVDHNGCDTRNDILNRDLAGTAHKPGTGDCKVTTGTLADPYTATNIVFTAGQDTSSAVQIDHVVALSNAWQTGAQQLDAGTREQLANDPLNLLAVDGPANTQKSDGDAATWLPSNVGYRCHYVARQVAVKRAYHLWVTQPEKDAMTRILGGCPGEPLPGRGMGPAVEVAPSQAPAPEEPAVPEPQAPGPQEPAPQAPAPGGGAAYYKNCAAARAAGAAPLHRGDPGYSAKLDSDGDGVACEAK